MVPTLKDGDYVISSRWFRLGFWPFSLSKNCLVVVRHPHYDVIVKRLLAFDGSGRFLLAGENDTSVSTQDMSWCSCEQVLGKVLFRVLS